MSVKIAKFGETVKVVDFVEGMTVTDAAISADISLDSCDIKRAGEVITATTSLRDGDVIMLVPRIKGGLNT